MDQNKNIKSANSVHSSEKEHKREIEQDYDESIIYNLSKEFDLSEDEINEILINFIEKNDDLVYNLDEIKINNFESVSKNNEDYNYQDSIIYQQNDGYDAINTIQNSEPDAQLKSSNSEILKSNEPSSDVDEILSDILPDYNKNVSIEVSHVNLTFDVVYDKVDTIKETVIRTLKRKMSKKIKFQVLHDVTFKIYKGEKIGIIGYNGAGKSTLLNVICGIYPPDEGYVKTYGKISPLLSLGAGFDYNYSGRRNIFLNGAVLGYDRKFLESKVDEIIEFSELGDFIDFPIKNYSSGMLAKLGFSVATAVNPDILVIDEILGVGDASFTKKSRDKIRSLMDGGTTVLLVSHSIPQIRELCDKAIWVDDGRIREIGEVNKVCDHYLKDAEKASNEQLLNIQFR